MSCCYAGCFRCRVYGPPPRKSPTAKELRALVEKVQRLMEGKRIEDVRKRYPSGPWPFQRPTSRKDDRK